MKRIITSIVMSILIAIRLIANTNILSSTSYSYSFPGYSYVAPTSGASFYQLESGDPHLKTEFIDYVHQQPAISSLLTKGLTRFVFNLYDNNSNFIKQYFYNEPELTSFGINSNNFEGLVINHSNSIVVNDKMITYLHQDDTNNATSRNKLVVIDINTDELEIVELTDILETTFLSADYTSNIKLHYLNNKYYLLIDSIYLISEYFVSEISFDLSAQKNNNGNYDGTYKIIATEDPTSIIQNGAVNKNYCYTFGNEVYCTDNQLSGVHNVNIADIYGISNQNIFAFDDIIVILDIEGIGLEQSYFIEIYRIVANQVNNGIEYQLGTRFEVDSDLIRFTKINTFTNTLSLNAGDKQYLVDLSDYNVDITPQTPSYFFGATRSYYNEVGIKLKINISENENARVVSITSDYDNQTRLIPLPLDYDFLAAQYYQDYFYYLLKHVNNNFSIYKYPINNVYNHNSTLVKTFDNQSLVSELDNDITDLNLVSFVFYRNKLILLDDFNIDIGVLNVVVVNLDATIESFEYSFDSGAVDDSNIYPSTQLRVYEGVDGLLILNFYAEIETAPAIVYLVLANTLPPDYPLARFKSFFVDDQPQHPLFLFLNNQYYLFDPYNFNLVIISDGASQTYTVIPLPPAAREIIANRLVNYLFNVIDLEYPYPFMPFSIDSYHNIYLIDYLGNEFVLYNQTLLNSTEIGSISINDTPLNPNSVSFSGLVINGLNNITIYINQFFKQSTLSNSGIFNLNDGENIFNFTLSALNNTIKTLTFNVFKVPNLELPAISSSTFPPILLPGKDPNYVSSSPISTSSSQTSAIISSSISSTSSAISSSKTETSSTSTNSVISSSISSIISNNNSSIGNPSDLDQNSQADQENPLKISFLLLFPGIITIGIFLTARVLKVLKNKRKNKTTIKNAGSESKTQNNQKH